MTLNEIRQQLKTIRLYYTNKARFSDAFDALPHTVKELAEKYAAIVNAAPLDLYYIYFELYVKGLTQEATAEDLNYSTEYIRQKNKAPRVETRGISFSGITLNFIGCAQVRFYIGLPAMHWLLATRKRVPRVKDT